MTLLHAANHYSFHAGIPSPAVAPNFLHNDYTTELTNATEPTIGQFLPFILQLSLLQTSDPLMTSTRQDTAYPFRTEFFWSQIDYEFLTPQHRRDALASKSFIPENNLPLGVEVYSDRVFITTPQWKDGIPASLSTISRYGNNRSPKLKPYPNWAFHMEGKVRNCEGITSAFRMQVDSCSRLWVLDSGQLNLAVKPVQICPPMLFVFDLKTDRMLVKYEFPASFIKQDSLYTNIAIDAQPEHCEDAHAYMTDVWRFGLVVYSLKKERSWRITDHLFYPEPLAAAYHLHGLDWEWTDGIFGMAIGVEQRDPMLYFHPMSSFREFRVRTSILRNETGWSNTREAFQVTGQSRGRSGQASASGMARNGVMFFNMVTRDQVACWDTRKPYKRDNIGVVAQSAEALLFPNDLKLDHEAHQSVWVLSNRLPIYLYGQLNPKEINFRILSALVDHAIENNICNPELAYPDTFTDYQNIDDCY